MASMDDTLALSPIPVIDLNDENAPELIGRACKTWGVFLVVNHNIKKSLIDTMEAAAKDLFALPMEQKLKAERKPGSNAGYGRPPISLSHPKRNMSEGFFISESPLEHARLLWPMDHKPFCDAVDESRKEMSNLASRLFALIFGSIGITKDEVPKDYIKCPYLQLNSYQACSDRERAIGLQAHTDSTTLTILHQNSTGLQVHKEGFGWVDVPYLPGALVVNVGDLLQILSNDLFTSVFHRAFANPTQHRVTLAYIFGPPSDVKVFPWPKLVDESHPALYRAVTWNEYREIKFKDFGKGIALGGIRTQVSEDVDANDHVKCVVNGGQVN